MPGPVRCQGEIFLYPCLTTLDKLFTLFPGRDTLNCKSFLRLHLHQVAVKADAFPPCRPPRRRSIIAALMAFRFKAKIDHARFPELTVFVGMRTGIFLDSDFLLVFLAEETLRREVRW